MTQQRPSIRHRHPLQPRSSISPKFRTTGNGNAKFLDRHDTDVYDDAAARDGKETYFFYGTLMDPATLQRVSVLPERPRLRPAYIKSYCTKLCGPYPALLNGPSGSIVRGMSYELDGQEKKAILAAYEETGNYKEVSCVIVLDNGTEVRGKTLMWAGNMSALREGSFDLKDWQMRRIS